MDNNYEQEEIKERNPTYDELWNYAVDIVRNTTGFREFAEAIMDYMGEPNEMPIHLYDALSKKERLSEVKFDDSYSFWARANTLRFRFNRGDRRI